MNNWHHHNHHWQNQHNNWNHHPGWSRRITIEEAMHIALQRVQGEVVKIELESEKGMLVYEVEIVTPQGIKYEVDVDVNSGAVLEVKLD